MYLHIYSYRYANTVHKVRHLFCLSYSHIAIKYHLKRETNHRNKFLLLSPGPVPLQRKTSLSNVTLGALHFQYYFSSLRLIHCDGSTRSLQDALMLVFSASHQNQLTNHPPRPLPSPILPPTSPHSCQKSCPAEVRDNDAVNGLQFKFTSLTYQMQNCNQRSMFELWIQQM